MLGVRDRASLTDPVRATVALPDELLDRLDQAARTERTSRSALVREMIADGLDRLAAGARPTAGPARVPGLIIRTPPTTPPGGTITTWSSGPGGVVQWPTTIEPTQVDRFGHRLPPAVY